MNNEDEPKVTHCNLLKFRCDQTWRSLTETREPRVRFCERCKEAVYFCSSRAEFDEHSAQRHCVAFAPGWRPENSTTLDTSLMVGTPGPEHRFESH